MEKAGARAIHKEACNLVNFAIKDEACQLWVKSVKVRDEKLYINFENMAAKENFDKNRQRILARARMYYSDNLTRVRSVGLLFREIVSQCEWSLPRDQEQYFKKTDELSKGEFKNNIKNPKIRAIFEDIRAAIKKRNEL